MLDFDKEQSCYGCSLCEAVCPNRAIQMKDSKEGFLIPFIDEGKCVLCGKCEHVCLALKEYESRDIREADTYAANFISAEKNKESTSGGVFWALAEMVLGNGGYVCGVVWNHKMEAIHIVTNDLEQAKEMKGSKYVQSKISTTVYSSVKELLKEGKSVLFSGTPCQVESVRRFTGDPENLLTVAVICEGVPSPAVWKENVREMEAKEKAKMSRAYLRKTDIYGWISPIAEYHFENGRKRKTVSYTLDQYVHAFIYGFFMRKSCYQCAFKGDGHSADIIVGDYWGASNQEIRQNKNRGISVVFARTEKGKEWFLKCQKDRLQVRTIPFDNAWKNNVPMMYSIGENPLRDSFLKEFSENGYHSAMERYGKQKGIKYIIAKVLHYFRLIGVVKKLKRK